MLESRLQAVAGGRVFMVCRLKAELEQAVTGFRDTRSLPESRQCLFAWVGLLLVLHTSMLAWGALRQGITLDETAHLPAGMSHWQFGRFDLFNVNPPLVRMVAALPVLFSDVQTDWSRYRDPPPTRSEFQVAIRFVQLNGYRSFWYVTLARWACIPLSLLGGYVCFRWARELHGDFAGLLALTLWCFSPNVLAHAQLITPDVGATALGVAAAYCFARWLKRPRWPTALLAGIVLGLAELAKTTWIVLFALWPLLWLLWRWPQRRNLAWKDWRAQCLQIAGILFFAAYVLNLGYGFEGSFRRLGEYEFASRALGGPETLGQSALIARNRFSGTWLGRLPVPLPNNYVQGIDQTKHEFEQKKWSYLRGQWRFGGWWYYYVYALAIKVPLGTWILLLLALFATICLPGYSASWRDELLLLAPLLVLLTFVSSQTGYSHHLRYVLPVFPFAFIWMSKLARAVDLQHPRIALLVGGALLWSVASSLWIYPHSLSYFNELVGGPKGGHAHLDYSNIDWGQDLLYLKRWLDKHPEARPLGFAYSVRFIDPSIAGIECSLPPVGPDYDRLRAPGTPQEPGPLPGWYAMSVQRLIERGDPHAYFWRFQPAAMAGYSIRIYHITLDDANRVRREMELPELRAAPTSASAPREERKRGQDSFSARAAGSSSGEAEKKSCNPSFKRAARQLPKNPSDAE